MRKAIAFIVILLIVLAVLGLGVYELWQCGTRPELTNPQRLACVRDVAIIVLVFETFVVTSLLFVIVLLFGGLINTIQEEIVPVLRSAQRTVHTVEGTTRFVSDSVVAPIISLAGFGASIRGTLNALMKRRTKGGVGK